jgi:hypothetical protein
MKRLRRRDTIELNFDGLTDAVTNLVGTLILLVVLVMMLTRESASFTPRETAAGADQQPQSAVSLLERIEVLREQIRQVQREVQTLEDDLPGIQARIAALLPAEESPQ